jgi:hypothetical protein
MLMNPRLILLVPLLALPLSGQEITTVAPEVSNLLAQPDDNAKQRNILHLLPRFIGHSIELEALSRHMRLDLLEATDCLLLARTALELERAQQSNLAGIRPPQSGGVVDPVARLSLRLAQLALPTSFETFYEEMYRSRNDNWRPIAGTSRYWSSLISWIHKQGIKSPEALAIKAEVERFSTQPDSAHPQAEVKPLSSVRPPKEAPEATATASTLSEEPTSSNPWSIIVVLIVAAIGLLWLLVKKRN